MLIKNKELNNMTNKTDYTTLSNYFTLPTDDDKVLDEIQKKLYAIADQIEDMYFDLDGNARKITDYDSEYILNKLQKLLDQYKGNK